MFQVLKELSLWILLSHSQDKAYTESAMHDIHILILSGGIHFFVSKHVFAAQSL